MMLHADETPMDDALAGRLVATQFPVWADLPLARVRSNGTDHALFRLGGDKALRLPRHPRAALQVEKEQRWLPVLAPRLPLAVPTPLWRGKPGAEYPHPWSVCRWLEGGDAGAASVDDPERAAEDLAGFIRALRELDATDGPPPGPHNATRGVPLIERNSGVCEALAQLEHDIDVARARTIWEDCLRAPPWRGRPVWLHGDLHPTNLLVRRGRLAAVIDFGCLGVGDPACDVMAAWTVFSGGARRRFRDTLSVDGATWRRGRGWALSMGLIALPYYRDTLPAFAAAARRMIVECLADGV